MSHEAGSIEAREGAARVEVALTDAAREVLGRVKAERGEELALVIGGGCCDATAAFLFAGYLAGPGEVLVAQIEGVPVFLDRALAPSFDGAEAVIDAVPDPQGDSFSCEGELGYRLCLSRALVALGPAPEQLTG